MVLQLKEKSNVFHLLPDLAAAVNYDVLSHL